jgi:CheY-like chemotaxis protein
MVPNPKKVLIVDDDLSDVYLLHRALRHCGVQNVQSLTTVEEASKYMVGLSPHEHRWLPDMIIVDLKLGGIDGFQFIVWLKRNPLFSNIPLIVMSGSPDSSDKEKALEAGAVAFYQKTGQASELKAIVEDVLNLNTTL